MFLTICYTKFYFVSLKWCRASYMVQAFSWHCETWMVQFGMTGADLDGACETRKELLLLVLLNHGRGTFRCLEPNLLGFRRLLSWLKELGWTAIEVESEAVGAISEISNGSSCSLICLLRRNKRFRGKKFEHF
ncbi:unnamed protein product, partial [Cuscuta epithymum]